MESSGLTRHQVSIGIACWTIYVGFINLFTIHLMRASIALHLVCVGLLELWDVFHKTIGQHADVVETQNVTLMVRIVSDIVEKLRLNESVRNSAIWHCVAASMAIHLGWNGFLCAVAHMIFGGSAAWVALADMPVENKVLTGYVGESNLDFSSDSELSEEEDPLLSTQVVGPNTDIV